MERLIRKLAQTLGRYPLVISCAIVAAIASSVALEWEVGLTYDSPEAYSLYVFLIITALLGISLQFALAMAQQRYGFAKGYKLVGLLPLVLFYFLFFPDSVESMNNDHLFVLLTLGVVLHLLVAFVPFWKGRNNQAFWQYNQSLFVYSILTAVFTGVLVGGVQLAVLAFENLFDLDFDERIYSHIFATGGIVGSVLVFLSFIGSGFKNLSQDSEYPIVLKFFTQFVLIPLLILYVVILYGYGFKILWTWNLPQGYVSYLVMGFSFLGILALLLVHPLVQEKGRNWVRVFHRVFYYTLIPILALLFVAIGVRIDTYGFTEPRYVVLAIGFWLLLLTIYFIIKPKGNIRIIPISLAAMGIFALIMPFCNAFSLSERSQEKRLRQLLAENNLLVDGGFDFDAVVPDSILVEVEDKLRYFTEKDQLNTFSEWTKNDTILRKNFEKNTFYYSDLRDRFSNRTSPPEKVQHKRASLNWGNSEIATHGFEKMIVIEYNREVSFWLQKAKYEMRMTNTVGVDFAFQIEQTENKEVLFRKAFSELFPDTWSELKTPKDSLSDASIFVDFELEEHTARLQITQLEAFWNNERLANINASFVLLLKP